MNTIHIDVPNALSTFTVDMWLRSKIGATATASYDNFASILAVGHTHTHTNTIRREQKLYRVMRAIKTTVVLSLNLFYCPIFYVYTAMLIYVFCT